MTKAKFIICQNDNGLFAARTVGNCSKLYLPGGVLGQFDTFESLCKRQGWNIEIESSIYAEVLDNGVEAEWFVGKVTPVNPRLAMWADQDSIERNDHLAEGAFDAYDKWKAAQAKPKRRRKRIDELIEESQNELESNTSEGE